MRLSQAGQHIKNITTNFNRLAYRHDMHMVFEDFLYFGAAAFSNAVDKVNYDAREKEYLRRMKRYNEDESELFAVLLAELVMCFEVGGPNDYLGLIFMQLNLGNKFTGQYFTPYDISLLMAQMKFTKEDIEEAIAEKGHITISDPCVGAGGMIIAAYQVIGELGFNPQQIMRVTTQDVDLRAVLMTYIQSTILNIDNTVILGNSLTLECRDVWRTPSRFLRLSAMLSKLSSGKQPTNKNLLELEDFAKVNEQGQLTFAI